MRISNAQLYCMNCSFELRLHRCTILDLCCISVDKRFIELHKYQLWSCSYTLVQSAIYAVDIWQKYIFYSIISSYRVQLHYCTIRGSCSVHAVGLCSKRRFMYFIRSWTVLCTTNYEVRAQLNYKRTGSFRSLAQIDCACTTKFEAHAPAAFGRLYLYTYMFGHIRSRILKLQNILSNKLFMSR